MGAKLVTFNFTPKENEEIDTIITVPEEPRSIIHGVVKDSKGNATKDAVVKLFMAKSPSDMSSLKPITHTFTDEYGQFLFGPLVAGKHYVVKVWVNDVKKRDMDVNSEDLRGQQNTSAAYYKN